jgi:hypothetical protein
MEVGPIVDDSGISIMPQDLDDMGSCACASDLEIVDM